MDIQVGHLPDPRRLDTADYGGQLVGTVEKVVMNEPDPDRLGPYIRRALRDGFAAEFLEVCDGSRGVAEC